MNRMNDDEHHNHDNNNNDGTTTTTTTTTTSLVHVEELFSKGVADLFMTMEELKQKLQLQIQPLQSSNTATTKKNITNEFLIHQLHPILNRIFSIMDALYQWEIQLYQSTTNSNHNTNTNSNTNSNHTNTNSNAATSELFQHCLQKSIQICYDTIQNCMKYYIEPTVTNSCQQQPQQEQQSNELIKKEIQQQQHDNNEQEEVQYPLDPITIQHLCKEGQTVMARLIEICFQLVCMEHEYYDDDDKNRNQKPPHHNDNNQQQKHEQFFDELTTTYVQYQRTTLRTRVKPLIAQLVQIRNSTNPPSFINPLVVRKKNRITKQLLPIQGGKLLNVNDDEEEDDDPKKSNHVDGGSGCSVNEEDDDDSDMDDNDNVNENNDQNGHQHPHSTSTNATTSTYHNHHGTVIATILSESATLIHPLLSWMAHLPPPQQQLSQQSSLQQPTNTNFLSLNEYIRILCTQSIQTIHEQTIILIQSVCNWFYEDRYIDTYWMEYCTITSSSSTTSTNITTTSTTATIRSPTKKKQKQILLRRKELIQLDGMLEEMAVTCQLLERYNQLLQPFQQFIQYYHTNHNNKNDNENDHNNQQNGDGNNNTSNSTVEDKNQQLISEQIRLELMGKYTALECFFVVQQYCTAYKYSYPVSIVLGTAIHVPSIVEDTHYICQRSLERAASSTAASNENNTNNTSCTAVGKVAYSISHDVWSTKTTTATTTSTNSCTHEVKSESTIENENKFNKIRTVYQSLLEERGCWQYTPSAEEMAQKEEREKRMKMLELGRTNDDNEKQQQAPRSGDFATALLDALDSELLDDNRMKKGSSTTLSTSSTTRTSGGSGGGSTTTTTFLSSLVMTDVEKERLQQKELDTQYCVLNGFHAAKNACYSLIQFIDTIMIQEQNDDDDNNNNNTTTTTGKMDDTDQKNVVVGGTSVLSTITPSSSHGDSSMIQLARVELQQYMNDYQNFLNERIQDTIKHWCGNITDNPTNWLNHSHKKHNTPVHCLEKIMFFFFNENYQLDGNQMIQYENDERLHIGLIQPFYDSRFIQQVPYKCDGTIIPLCTEYISQFIVDSILYLLLHPLYEYQQQQKQQQQQNASDPDNMMPTTTHRSELPTIISSLKKSKQFTDWGAMLFSTEIRTIQSFITTSMFTPPALQSQSQHSNHHPGQNNNTSTSSTSTTTILSPKIWFMWEKVSQILSILQLERPSDWLAYQHQHSSSTNVLLTKEEVAYVLSLRIDFTKDAINSVVTKF